MENRKAIEQGFADAIAKAVLTATGRTIQIEVTMIGPNDCSILCDSVAALNEAMRFIECVPGMRLDSVDMDPECGAIAYYKF